MSTAPAIAQKEIAGYTIRKRIGAGGYGEVWTAEAPGGLEKAIKFVYGYLDEARASRELKALNRIKTVRHPFLLSLERIEVIEGQLVIVTELAEASLKDRFEECQKESSRGIPRDELLRYMSDAAEALDYMNEKHGLQHLDVKPENMLLSAGRVKVADFGLVKDLQDVNMSMMGGLTPAYAAPEVFSSQPSTRSDQYSLAIMFQELLTGVLPFPGRTAAQLASQHMSAKPNIAALPASDQPVILRALAKDPSERFATCQELVEHLKLDSTPQAEPNADEAAPINSRQATEQIPKRQTMGPAAASSTPKKSYASELHSRVAQQVIRELSQTEPAKTLPPHDTTVEVKLQPHLIVSIGGAAAMTAKAFLNEMRKQYGDLANLPAVDSLFLDADQNMPRMLEESGYPAPPDDHMVLARLKSVQQYRSDSQKYLKWLSRRWLYNIPKSHTPESMRPLARLAFVDQEDSVRQRLTALIAQITDPQAIASTSATLAAEFDPKLRIVVVASSSGGVGGGALLDVGNWIRQSLSESNVEADVNALLIHGTGRNADKHDLAVANTYATLAEVNDRIRRERAGQLEAALPFDEVSLHLLGENLSPEEWKEKTRNAGRYLALLFSPAGARLEQVRQEAKTKDEDEIRPVSISTFHASVIGKSTDGLTSGVLDSVRSDVIDRWRHGTAIKKLAKDEIPYQACLNTVHELMAGLQLRVGDLEAEVDGMISRAATGTLVNKVVELWQETLEIPNIADITDQQMVPARRIAHEWLGVDVEGTREYPEIDALDKLADSLIKKFLQGRVAPVRELISHLADEPVAGMSGAKAAAKELRDQLSAMEKAYSDEHDEKCREAAQLVETMQAVAKMTPAEIKKNPPKRDALMVQFFRALARQLTLRKSLQIVRFVDEVVADLNRNICGLDRELASLAPTKAETLGLEDDEPSQSDGKQTSLLRQATENLLEKEQENVVARIDADIRLKLLRNLGGFSKIVLSGKTLRDTLAGPLRSSVKRHVESALQQIRLTEIVSKQQEMAAAEAPAQPEAAELCQCGGAIRWLLMLPEGSPDSTLPGQVAEKIEATPAVDYHRAGEVTLFCIADEIPLSRVGAHLIGHAGQFAEVAERVHTRSDIDWLPLFAQ